MATIASLNVNLSANTAEFDSKLEKAEKQAANFNKSLERQIATFGMTSREAKIYGLAQRGVSEETLAAARAMDKQLTAMEQAAKGSITMKDAISRLTGGLSALAPAALAVTAVLSGIAIARKAFDTVTDGIMEQFKAADQMNDMAIKLGISYASLAGLAGAAKLSGSDLAGVGKGAAKLQMNLGNNSEKTEGALGKIGLKADDLKAVPITEAIARIADGMQGLTNASDKAAVATALFGKAGQDMIPLLDGGGDAIRRSSDEAERFGLALSGIDAQKIADANDEWDRAQEAIKGVFLAMAVELSPAIGVVATMMQQWGQGARNIFEDLTNHAGLFTDALTAVGIPVQALIDGFKLLNPEFEARVSYMEAERQIKSINDAKAKAKAAGGDGASANGDLENTWDATDILDFVGTPSGEVIAVKKGKAEVLRIRSAEEISPGLNDKLEKPIEHRFAAAALRGSLQDYQTRLNGRGGDAAAAEKQEAKKFQKEAIAEAKRQNQLLSDIERKLPPGVDMVEIA